MVDQVEQRRGIAPGRQADIGRRGGPVEIACGEATVNQFDSSGEPIPDQAFIQHQVEPIQAQMPGPAPALDRRHRPEIPGLDAVKAEIQRKVWSAGSEPKLGDNLRDLASHQMLDDPGPRICGRRHGPKPLERRDIQPPSAQAHGGAPALRCGLGRAAGLHAQRARGDVGVADLDGERVECDAGDGLATVEIERGGKHIGQVQAQPIEIELGRHLVGAQGIRPGARGRS